MKHKEYSKDLFSESKTYTVTDGDGREFSATMNYNANSAYGEWDIHAIDDKPISKKKLKNIEDFLDNS